MADCLTKVKNHFVPDGGGYYADGYMAYNRVVNWDYHLMATDGFEQFYTNYHKTYVVTSIPLSIGRYALRTVLSPIISLISAIVFPIMGAATGKPHYYKAGLFSALTVLKDGLFVTFCFFVFSKSTVMTLIAVGYGIPLIKEIVRGTQNPAIAYRDTLNFPLEDQMAEGIACYNSYQAISNDATYNKIIKWDYHLMGTKGVEKFYANYRKTYIITSIPLSIIRYGLRTALGPVIKAISMLVLPIIGAIKGDSSYHKAGFIAAVRLAAEALFVVACFYVFSKTKTIVFVSIGYGIPLLQEIVKGVQNPADVYHFSE